MAGQTGEGICGVILLACGIASTVSGSVWVSSHGYGGYGIWSGIGLMIAGILGIVSWCSGSKGVLIGFLVITIIMVIVATSQAVVSGMAYSVFKGHYERYQCGSETSESSHCGHWNDLVKELLTITICNAIGAFFSLVGSTYGCSG